MSAAGIGVLGWLFSRFGLPGLLIGGAVLYFMSGGLGGGGGSESAPADPSRGDSSSPAEAEAVQFVSFVLDDAQSTWRTVRRRATSYPHAKLVLSPAGRSRAAARAAAIGAVLLPARPERVHRPELLRELERRFGAPGDFAQAYVIAHEIGHHVQNLLGTTERVHSAARGAAGTGSASVRLELQADCFAGMWAHRRRTAQAARGGRHRGGLGAAAAIGDDRLQKQRTARSARKLDARLVGAAHALVQARLQPGSVEACDTFAADVL